MSNAEEPHTDTSRSISSLDAPSGMLRLGVDGDVMVDALSGRCSVFGFGFAPLQEAMQMASRRYVGDAASLIDWDEQADEAARDDRFLSESEGGRLTQHVDELFTGDGVAEAASMLLRPSADSAVDTAIRLARRWRGDQTFRTIALVGSDHGRTGMCRSASGRPELHDGLGPMMAGFSHLAAGDVNALRNAVDEQTACVLLSPLDLGKGGAALDSDYLQSVREVCDERNLLLIIDETQLVLGASGRALTFRSLADIQADVAIVSAGLFAGLPGGLIVASAKVASASIVDVYRFPMQAVAASRTLAAMRQRGLPQSSDDGTHPLAVAIAKTLNGFEFVRDVHAAGTTIGIETDLEVATILRAAQSNGLRLGRAGDTSVLLQPPLLISDDDQQRLLSRLVATMEAVERESAELAI